MLEILETIGNFFSSIAKIFTTTINMLWEAVEMFYNLIMTANFVIPYLPAFIITACGGTIVLGFIKTFLQRGGGG